MTLIPRSHHSIVCLFLVLSNFAFNVALSCVESFELMRRALDLVSIPI